VFLGRDIGHEQNYSDAIAYEIDKEMQQIIQDCYQRCTDLLTKYRDDLEAIAQTLLVKETLDASEIKQIIETGKLEESDEGDEVKVQIQGKKEERAKADTDQEDRDESESTGADDREQRENGDNGEDGKKE
jgi:cell division protease FtsH